MTFYDIWLKMLTANFKKYKLYFLCNVLSIILFYSFAAIFTNKSFMDGKIVDCFISSNIYAPSVFVAIFTALFIPYSCNAFFKNRKHEYGILMSLGMSGMEAVVNIIVENCIIAVISLVSGLILGTAVSFAFYFIIQNVIKISGLKWYFNIDSYKVTSVLYGIIMLFSLAAGILGFVKMQVTDLIKEKFKKERKGKSFFNMFILGVALIIISAIILRVHNDGLNFRLISLIMMFSGLCMVIMNMESIERYFGKMDLNYMKRHVLEVSFVRQHNKSHGIIIIISVLLIGFCIFFVGLCAANYYKDVDNAVIYSPYDMVYSKIFKMNQVGDHEIEKLLNQNGVSIKKLKQVKYLRNSACNLLSVQEVNKKFNCHYQVPKGKFLTIFQYYLKDGYGHEMLPLNVLDFNCSGRKLELKSEGSDVKILFNQNPTFADQTFILNDCDYDKISSGCDDIWDGVIKLYSFNSWQDSKMGVDAVQKYLLEKNNVGQSEQKQYYRASSKIETYITAKKSAKFLIFLMFFVEILFCGASDIMVHFRIMSESEEEKRTLSSLYRIGVTNGEMFKMVWCKNMYYFMPQVIIGIIVGGFYSYMVSGFYVRALAYSVSFGIIFLVFQWILVKNYSKREFG